MTHRFRKLGTLVAVAATAALTLSATGAHASGASAAAKDSDDNYNPAGAGVIGHSNSTVFTIQGGALAVTCTDSSAGGTTPAAGLGTFKLSPRPNFNDVGGGPCTDNAGGTDVTVTKGTWKIGFLDAARDESQAEPNAGDKLQVFVPLSGAKVTETPLGCVIIVNPSTADGGTQPQIPFKVKGTYDDVNTFTVNIVNLPVIVSGAGCPTGNQLATFNGIYHFTPNLTDGS